MYDLVRPPTDSLYKFMALSGLVCVVLAFVYQETVLTRLQAEIIEVEDALDRTQLEYAEGLGRASDELREAVGEAVRPEGPMSDELLAEWRQRLNHADSAVAAANRAESDMDRILLELRQRVRRMSLARSRARSAQRDVWVGLLFGCGLAVIGFHLWYRRVQRYEDYRLAMEAGDPWGAAAEMVPPDEHTGE